MPMFRCLCGHLIEGVNDAELHAHLRAHADEVHSQLEISDAEIDRVISDRARLAPWSGESRRLSEAPRICPLDRDPADFLAFFDRDAFMDNPMWATCYCMFPHLGISDEEWDTRSGEQNRADKVALIRSGEAGGYLAYDGDRVIGWCHAAPRTTLHGITSRDGFAIDHDPAPIGSIACFVVAAPYRRQGVARRLLDAACEGFRAQGLAFAEGYPRRDAGSDARAHFGPLQMYLDAGFTVHHEGDRIVVVRKPL